MVAIVVITLAILAYTSSLLYRHVRDFGFVCADDAYITFRYAKNLASGTGLVYNPDERVEGFSNPLWTFTLAIASALGYNIELSSRDLGFFFSFLALLVSILLAMRLANSKFIAPLAAGLMLTGSTSFILYSVSGLETAQYGFALVLSAYLVTFANPILRALVPILGLLIALSRPEGILVSLLLWAISAWWILKSNGSQRMTIGIGLALALIGFGGFLLFRYLYFGDIYPNTYYAKPANWLVTTDSLSDLRKSVLSADAGFHGGLLLALLIAGAAAMSLSGGWLISAGIVLSGLAFLYYAGPDWMPFARFYAPYHPVLCAASVASIFALSNRKSPFAALHPSPGDDKHYGQPHSLKPALSAESEGQNPSLWQRFVCAMLALMIGYLPQTFYKLDVKKFIEKRAKYPYHLVAGQFVRYVGKELKKLVANFEPYSISVAAKRIGAVGYFCPVKVDDPFGLVDKAIAQIYYRYRNSEDVSARDSEIANLIDARNPEMVLIFTEEPLRDPENPQKELVRLDMLQKRILKNALDKHYYFGKEFYKSGLVAYLYLRADFQLPHSTQENP